MEREKSGVYPGGPHLRAERYAVLGAPIFFWIKSAFTAGLYGAAVRIFVRGWRMFLAACAQKISVAVRGQRKTEILPLDFRPKETSEHPSQDANSVSAAPVRQTARR
jgi:hypothetical protein